MSIKIISGYSEKGGSTIALIELTNRLNEYGLDATFLRSACLALK
jgi:hypothetical protein